MFLISYNTTCSYKIKLIEEFNNNQINLPKVVCSSLTVSNLLLLFCRPRPYFIESALVESSKLKDKVHLVNETDTSSLTKSHWVVLPKLNHLHKQGQQCKCRHEVTNGSLTNNKHKWHCSQKIMLMKLWWLSRHLETQIIIINSHQTIEHDRCLSYFLMKLWAYFNISIRQWWLKYLFLCQSLYQR